MHQLIQFLTILLFAFLGIATPISQDKKTITLNQVLRPRILSKDIRPNRGIQAYAKALGKYGASSEHVSRLSALALKHGHLIGRAEDSRPRRGDRKTSSSRITSSTKRGIPSAITSSWAASGSVEPKVAGPLTNIPVENDVVYNTQLQIGDQVFWIDFDTGSSDFWVFGPNIEGLEPNQTLWHNSSTSKQLLGETWYSQYGDGSIAEGDVWTDQVILGSVVVPNAVVEVADVASGSYEAPMSGILGLGFDSINTVYPNKQKTLMTNLIESNLISEPVLSVDLRPASPGCYTFGEIPWWQYSGQIVYSPVNSSGGYWLTTPLGFGIGSGSTINNTAAAQSLLSGVIDTGTSINLLDGELLAPYYALVPSARLDMLNYGGWIYNCVDVLPNFELQVGSASANFTIVIPGTSIKYATISKGVCYTALQPTFGLIPFALWGDTLIKSAFIVFDRGAGGLGPARIGFAAKGTY